MAENALTPNALAPRANDSPSVDPASFAPPQIEILAGAPQVEFDVNEAAEYKSNGAMKAAESVFIPRVIDSPIVDAASFAPLQIEALAGTPRVESDAIEAPHKEAKSIGSPGIAENVFAPEVIDRPSVDAASLHPKK